MTDLSTRRQAAYYLLLFGLLLSVVPRAGLPDDVGFWVRWATYIFDNGLGNVYEVADNNYNPLYHYILWAYGKLAGSTQKIAYYQHALKGFTLLFDFAGALWAASLVPDRRRRFGLALLLLLNFGYLYDTLIWEQVDAIYTCLAFGAVVLALRQRPALSSACYVLALSAKTQAIIFLPPLLLLWGPLWWARPRWAGWAWGAGALTFLLIVAPFVWGGHQNFLPRIININLHTVDFAPKASMHCYNMWYLFLRSTDPYETPDDLSYLGLTYKYWGLLLFMLASAAALLPLLLVAVKCLGRRASLGSPAQAPAALVLLSCGLLPLLFSFFNTQMHERYWHASVLFLAAYGFVSRDYLPYVLVSVAYFLNLEALLHFLGLQNYDDWFFQPAYIAGLFALAILVGFFRLYRRPEWRAASSQRLAKVPTPTLSLNALS
ncbi:MAG: hypothetical protein ACRYG7_03770 [Janthinobacterium lividum]